MASDDAVDFDLDDLTVEEIEDIEEATGCSIDRLFADDRPRGKTLRAIAWIVKRREDPAFTFEQAGKVKIKLSDTPANPTGADA